MVRLATSRPLIHMGILIGGALRKGPSVKIPRWIKGGDNESSSGDNYRITHVGLLR
jgi:hypothetical protein